MYYVKLTTGKRERIIAKYKTKDAAYQKAEKAQRKYSKRGVDGLISVYQISDMETMPHRMIYDFWNVVPLKV